MYQEEFSNKLNLEWSNLRSEIFELDKACLSILQFAITLTSALLLLWTKDNSQIEPEFFYVLLSITWGLFYIYLYHKRLRILTIGGYLRVFIEDEKNKNLSLWLTHLKKYRNIRNSEKNWFLMPKPSYVEALFSLIVQLMVVIQLYRFSELKLLLFIPIIFLGLILSFSYFLEKFDSDEMWKKVKNQICD